MKTLPAIAIAAALATIPSSASAFSTLFDFGWEDRDAGYWISYSATSDPYAQPIELQRRAIRDGADSWEDQTGGAFDFFFYGLTGNASISADYRNLVFFRNQSDPAALARAYVWTQGSRISQFDIVYYDGWAWSNDNWHSGAFDIRGTAAHEFGHALGLGHSDEGSTMRSYHHTDSRWLNDDDRAGVSYLYP
jgi:hypothetical protein